MAKQVFKDPSIPTAAVYDPETRSEADPRLRYRVAQPSDAPAIAAVERGIFGEYAKPLNEVIALIAKDLEAIATGQAKRKVWLAEVEGEVVGFAKCSHKNSSKFYNGIGPDNSDAWVLSGVNVAKAWRRKGIGAQLVQIRLDWLAKHCKAVFYHTGLENHTSVALHSRFGFVEMGEPMLAPSPSGPKFQRWFKLRFISAESSA